MSGRRSGLALVVTGLVLAAGSAAGWRAAPPATAAELFSFQVDAAARGYQAYEDDPAGMRNGEVLVPEASTSLAAGPIGMGRASVAWPGDTGGNAGSLIKVLRPDAPDEVTVLNDPVKAEAHTGQDPPKVSNDSVPGVTMQASAVADEVTADAAVQGSAADPGSFGHAESHARSASRDGKATADAAGRVEDVVLAGGVVKIESVVSTASAHADGTAADGAAATTVTGLTIAGQPARIDENGLRLGDQSQPANAVANQIAQQALQQAGIELVLSAPTKETTAGGVRVDSGALVVTWTTPGSIVGVVLGGARAGATAVAGDPAADLVDAAGGDAPLPDLGAATPAVGGASAPELPAVTGASTARDTPNASGGAPGDVHLGTAAAFTRRVRIRAGMVLLALLAAALVAEGLRRLADDAFGTGPRRCPREAA